MKVNLEGVERRLFNIELLLLDIKIPISKDRNKGQVIDLDRALQITGLTRAALLSSIKKNNLPIYFFEDELLSGLSLANGNTIAQPEKSTK